MGVVKAVNSPSSSHAALRNTLEYILKDSKTSEDLKLVAGMYFEPTITADAVFRNFTDQRATFGKDNGRMFKHFILSWSKDENITPELGLAITNEWVEQIFPEFNAVIVSHTDRDHVHCHIVVNSVNNVTGKKLRISNSQFQNMKDINDILCKQYGLSVVEKGKHFDGSKIPEGTMHSYNKKTFRTLTSDDNKRKVLVHTNKGVSVANNTARLPTDTLITEFEEFIRYRGTLLSFSSMEKDRQCYQQVTDFITTVKPAITSMKELHSLPIDKLLRRWFLCNGIPMTYTQKKRSTGKISTLSHPLFGYVKALTDYFTDDDGSFHYEDDIWELKRLDIMLRLPAINTINILNFSQIPITEIKKVSKEVTLSRLKEASVSTVRAEVHATTQFAKFLEMYLPEIESFEQVTRTDMEEYLSYLYTVDDRKKSYRTELMHLKTVLNTAGKILSKRELSHVFLPTDFDRQTLGIFTFYTDAEIQRLNRGFKSLPPQVGRAMILQELLGIRISDTLTLKSDCVIRKADGSLFIHIHQPKVNRSFEKPISKEILSLIESSINYTTSLYGKCEYIFVCDKNPNHPMKYSMLHYHLSCMIHDLDLRDDNGNLFGVSTHIFRHVYGKRLCDMGLDDSTIAALLGHSGTSSVKHYRQMGNKALAQGTKQLRANKDAKIKQFKEEW